MLAALVRPRLLPPRAQPAPRRPARGGAPRRALPEDARGRARRPRRRPLHGQRRSSRSPTASPLPVVDGNVRRVLARLLRPARAGVAAATRPYYNRAEELLDRDAPGDWNQALMELGATVCTPRQPACPGLPAARRLPGPGRGHPGGAAGEPAPPRARGRDGGRRARGAATAASCWCAASEGRLMGRMWEVPQTSLEARGPRRPRAASCGSATASTSSRARWSRGRATPSRSAASASRPTAARLRREPPRDPERFRLGRPGRAGLAARSRR